MAQTKPADRRVRMYVSLGLKLEKELRDLAEDEGKMFNETVNWLLEWALEKRHQDIVLDAIYHQARSVRIMVDQMAVEQFGIEIHKKMVDEIAAVCRRDLKNLRS